MKRGIVVGALLAVSGTAWAYMLPGSSLLRKAEQKREELGVSSVQVNGTFTLAGPAAQALASKLGRPVENGELSVPAVASYKTPGRCRIELAPGGSAHPFATDRNGVVAGSDDFKVGQDLLAVACPLLAARGGDAEVATLIEWAKRSGIDFQELSLARAPNAIAEVIGAGPKDPAAPQLWIDKDNFVPLRIVLKRGGATLDVRFDPGAGILDAHPRTVELWQLDAKGAGTLLARFSAEKIDAAAKVDDKLF